jgi:hypothetical protein
MRLVQNAWLCGITRILAMPAAVRRWPARRRLQLAILRLRLRFAQDASFRSVRG